MSRGHDMIERVLREHYGDDYKPEPQRVTNSEGRDTPFAELNQFALKNLDAWVPELGIHKCRSQRGRHRSYVGVAQWRGTTTGQKTEDRDAKLKNCASGIKDFGDDKGYSPIDLVMAAKGCGLTEAVSWLDEKLGWSSGGPGIDVEACRAKQTETAQAPPQPEEEPHVVAGPWPGSKGEPPGKDIGPDRKERVRPGSLLGAAWYFGDPAPEQLPMLVPFFIPARGFGYLGGQWGTFKTFVVNDLAVAIASGGKFAGQQVSGRGVVIQIELEG